MMLSRAAEFIQCSRNGHEGQMSAVASRLGSEPPARKRDHLFSCREALRSPLTSLFPTSALWFPPHHRSQPGIIFSTAQCFWSYMWHMWINIITDHFSCGIQLLLNWCFLTFSINHRWRSMTCLRTSRMGWSSWLCWKCFLDKDL